MCNKVEKSIDKVIFEDYNIDNKNKPVNKSSRIYQNFQRVGGRCEPTAEIYPNGLVRADRKHLQVVSDGA